MPRREFPGVSKFTDRHGRIRWRFRARHRKPVYLPADYGSPAFIEAYQAAVRGTPLSIGQARTLPGTIGALVAGYFESSDYKLLAPNTRRLYRYHLERFRRANGDKALHHLTTDALRDKLDRMADKAATANIFLKVMRALGRYALERKILKLNPAHGIKRLRNRTDGIHTWTNAELTQFEARHPAGTKANLALRLLLYTAQRRADVIRLGPQHERNGALVLRQRKTDARLVIPITPELREAIDATAGGHLTYLVTEFGKPFTDAGFGNWFRDRANEAGLRNCSAHGLRKAAARILAEAGRSAHEIMSITGHRSLAEVERYTRAAGQEQLARAAIGALYGTKPGRKRG